MWGLKAVTTPNARRHPHATYRIVNSIGNCPRHVDFLEEEPDESPGKDYKGNIDAPGARFMK